MPGRGPRLAALAALAVLLLLTTSENLESGFWGPDTDAVVAGTGAIDACLHADIWTSCNDAGHGEVSYFPLPQYIATLVYKRLGGSRDGAYDLLIGISAFSLVGLALVVWMSCVRAGRRAVAPVLTLALVASPLLWYADTGFPDALSALLIAAFAAVAALRGHPVLILAAGMAAGLTKEMAPPFVLLLGLAATWAPRWTPVRPRRLEIAALIAGPGLAFALHAGFNVFRFGEPRNEFYLRSEWLVPSFGRWLESFGGQLVAPNGGIAWFWLAAVAVLASTTVGVLGAANDRRGRLHAVFPWLILATLTALLSTWFGPLSWHAWSARYLVGWIPALVLLGALIDGPGSDAMLRRAVSRPAGALAVIACFTAAALPHIGARSDYARMYGGDVAGCPDAPDPADAPNAGDRFYVCQTDRAWTGKMVLVDALEGVDDARAILYAGLVAVVAAGGVLALRQEPPAGP